jgi:hypothetical protein
VSSPVLSSVIPSLDVISNVNDPVSGVNNAPLYALPLPIFSAEAPSKKDFDPAAFDHFSAEAPSKKDFDPAAFDHSKLFSALLSRKRKHSSHSQTKLTIMQRLRLKLARNHAAPDVEVSTSSPATFTFSCIIRQEHFDALQASLPVCISARIASTGPEPSGSIRNSHTDTEQFLQQDCSGHHIWLNPAYKDLRACLQHYLHCKAKDPHNTSAAILVPKHMSADWWPLLKGMHLTKEYPKGTHLYDNASALLPDTSIPVAMQVWYDKAQEQPSLLNSTTSKHFFPS